MTPEEKAVIDQAVRWSRTETVGQAEDASEALQDLVADLLRSRAPIHAGADGSCPDYGSTLDPCPPGCAFGECVAGLKFKQEMAALESNVEPEWVPATFAELWPGDRVRIGAQEADVTKVSRGDWHARNRVWIDDAGRERDHQTPWGHEELNVDLTANPGMHDYDPDTQCEILCTPERKAAILFQDVFPGTKPVD